MRYYYKTNDNISHICTQWTQLAKDCYLRGCRCEGCLINMNLETHCLMKNSVIELVKKFGAPPEKIEKVFTNYETKILETIKTVLIQLLRLRKNLTKQNVR